MKEFFKKIWEKIKAWAVKTAWPWIKKGWMQIVNMIVMFVAYDTLSDIGTVPGAETVVGLWLFILLAYYIFWKLFGLEKVLNKKAFDPQPEPPGKK